MRGARKPEKTKVPPSEGATGTAGCRGGIGTGAFGTSVCKGAGLAASGGYSAGTPGVAMDADFSPAGPPPKGETGVTGLGAGSTTFGGAAGGAGGAGRSTGLGGAAAGGAAIGDPQYPQNRLPAGRVFRHFGQVTCEAGGGAWGRGGVGIGVSIGWPQRAHLGEVAGFGLPHALHRI